MGENSLSFILADVITGAGIMPVPMGKDVFELKNIREGSYVAMYADVKADFAFNVYSDYEKVAYTVKGEFTSIKRHLHIFDVNGKEVATVKEKLFSMRPSAIVEANPVDIVFEINGKKIGKMNSKWSIGKRKFNLDFNDWNVEGNFVGWKYKILSGENTIADISMKLLYWGDTYVVSYDETQNPLLVLMIVLAIDVANAPKKTEDIKRTVHHKTHYWL